MFGLQQKSSKYARWCWLVIYAMKNIVLKYCRKGVGRPPPPPPPPPRPFNALKNSWTRGYAPTEIGLAGTKAIAEGFFKNTRFGGGKKNAKWMIFFWDKRRLSKWMEIQKTELFQKRGISALRRRDSKQGIIHRGTMTTKLPFCKFSRPVFFLNPKFLTIHPKIHPCEVFT